MRKVRIEIKLIDSYDYGVVVDQLARRLIPHEARLDAPQQFTIVVISSHAEIEHQVDNLLYNHNRLQAIKTPFSVVEKPKHASPVSFLKRAA